MSFILKGVCVIMAPIILLGAFIIIWIRDFIFFMKNFLHNHIKMLWLR